MHKILLLAIALAAGFLSSCATGPQMVWANAEKNDTQFYHDRAKCASMSGGAANPSDDIATMIAVGEQQKRIFNDCMMGEDWQLEPK